MKREFKEWLSTFRPCIADYCYYVDFEKVNKNVDDIIKKCNIEIYINKENQYELKINSEADGNKLFKELSKTDVEVTKFEIMKPSLNDIFIEKVGK